MKKFKHFVLETTPPADEEKLLNGYGDKGMELVSVIRLENGNFKYY